MCADDVMVSGSSEEHAEAMITGENRCGVGSNKKTLGEDRITGHDVVGVGTDGIKREETLLIVQCAIDFRGFLE